MPLSEHPGVVRLKVNPATTANVLELLGPFLATCSERDFTNRLVIVRDGGIRWILTSE
ncbi:MAG: hypothetical protein O2857_27455 [Planctomycetota bacterium]|nr:hypothetical protein [Planctomycetota bacterium]